MPPISRKSRFAATSQTSAGQCWRHQQHIDLNEYRTVELQSVANRKKNEYSYSYGTVRLQQEGGCNLQLANRAARAEIKCNPNSPYVRVLVRVRA